MKTLNNINIDLVDFYNSLAMKIQQKDIYDRPHQQERWNKTIEILQKRLKSTWNVLELGCYNGLMTKEIAPLVSHVDAIDISSVALSYAPQLANVTYFCTDINNFLLVNNLKKYDAIVATEVLEHLLDINKVLKLLFANKKAYKLISVPVNETLNQDGTFDLTKLGKEENLGDATGHVNIIQYEDLSSLFYTVLDIWTNNIHLIIGGY